MSDFPIFTDKQLEKIALENPAPCLEEAVSQLEGDDPSELAALAVRWGRLNECWDKFVLARTNESLHEFWTIQAQIHQWHRALDPDYWEPMTESALGVFPEEAVKVRISRKAKEGLRELRQRERELILQFKMR